MIQKLLVLLLITLTFNSSSQEIDTVDFIWTGDTINGVYFEKTSMLIPIQIKNDSITYYFQFDTGSNVSYIYTGNQYLPNKSGLNNVLGHLITNIGIIRFDTIDYKSPYLENGNLVVGTIGADVLKEKVLQIDYPNQKLVFSDSFEKEKFDMYDIGVSYGRPTIVMNVENNSYEFLFDTGSSIFELWTTKKIWKKLRRANAEVSEMPIWSWGKSNISFCSELENVISIYGCSTIQISKVSYNSNKGFRKSFKEAGVQGIIGNKPFLNEIILFDVSSKKIGIKKCT